MTGDGVQRRQRRRGELGDPPLDLGVGARVGDQPPQVLDLVERQLGPRASSSRGPRLAGRALQGDRDQHGALALREVVAGRLPGDHRVAVHPEQVVAQLEGLAEREPEAGQRLEQHRVGAGQRGADVQRPLDGVLRGLVAQHPHRLLDVRGAARLHRHVEELAGDDLAAGQVEEAERVAHDVVGQPAPPQQLVGPGQQQVAEQDRGRRAVLLGGPAPALLAVQRRERPVRRRPAAPGVGGVHEVVVHQRARVQQLQGGRGADQGRLVRDVRHGPRGSPTSRTPRGAACPPETAPRAASTTWAASAPSGSSSAACWSTKTESAASTSARKPAASQLTPVSLRFDAPRAGPRARALPRSGAVSSYAVAYDAADPPPRTAGQRAQCQRPDRLRASGPSRSSSSRPRTRRASGCCGRRCASSSRCSPPSCP